MEGIIQEGKDLLHNKNSTFIPSSLRPLATVLSNINWEYRPPEDVAIKIFLFLVSLFLLKDNNFAF